MMRNRGRTCSEIAAARGRHARERRRSAGESPLRGEIVFGMTWLASLMASLALAPFRIRSAGSRDPVTYVPTPRELGVPGPLRHRPSGRLHGRYRAAPSMSRILRDLKRPAAHDAATSALMARIGGDAITLGWVVAMVDAGGIWRLALHARPGVPDADVVAAWQAEARADRAAAEAEAVAALKASIAAANAAEGNDDGGHTFAPPRP